MKFKLLALLLQIDYTSYYNNMSISKIAFRYARSLLEISKEATDISIEQVHDDILYVWEVSKLPDFRAFIKNPLITAPKKIQTLEALFATKVSNCVIQTLKVVATHRREAYIKDICKIFHLLYNAEKHISTAKLITAVPISEATTQRILNEFRAKEFDNETLIGENVDLETVVDPSIIGGFILQFNNRVYDSSLSRKLDGLKFKFSKNLYIKNF